MSRSRVLPFALFALAAFALAPLAHAEHPSGYDSDRYGYNDGRGNGYRDPYTPTYEQGDYDQGYASYRNLHDEVHDAVDQALGADAARIRIDVRGSNVYLSGSVRNSQVRAIAHEVAHDVPGVRSVSMRNLYVSRGYGYRY